MPNGDTGALVPRAGDVIALTDGSLALVCAPWGEGLACVELDDQGNLSICGDEPDVVIAFQETIHRVLGHRDELPLFLDGIFEALSALSE